ncbi:hypothetical protein [Streptacidiphilus sp. PAMC 29251]
MAKLRAALTVGAAGSVLALLVLTPAVTATAAARPVAPGGGAAALVTTDVAAPAAAAAARSAAKAAATGLAALSVDPGTSRPGGIVDLRTFADCGGTQAGTVASSGFVAPVSLALAADGGLYAQAQVARTTVPGTYQVRELCAGKAVAVGSLTVVDPVAPDTGGGWGATRAGVDVLGGTTGEGALVLTGAALLGGLVLLAGRLRGSVAAAAGSGSAAGPGSATGSGSAAGSGSARRAGRG